MSPIHKPVLGLLFNAVLLAFLICTRLSHAADLPTAASLAASLTQVSLDPDQTYRVRELQLNRGDIKIYLTEGVLSFCTPIDNRRLAAVFTTEGVEAADAEVVVLPPQRSERASLNSFTDSPNLDEHISFAVLVFSDDTAKDVLAQIAERPLRKAPEAAEQMAAAQTAPLVRKVLKDIDMWVVQSLLDRHKPENGFFFAAVAGSKLGAFDVSYDPEDFEPVNLGRIAVVQDQAHHQLWTAFRPRHAPPYVVPSPVIEDYRIETAIHPDLSMSATARFHYAAQGEEGRAVAFSLSGRLKVESATIDGLPVEVFAHDTARSDEVKRGGTFLLAASNPLAVSGHAVEVHYAGSVIRQTGDGSYFVDDRNIWYPYIAPIFSNFDLRFECPAALNLISTGELLSDEVSGDVRKVHRKTSGPVRLAGFNLGNYSESSDKSKSYDVHSYSNRAQSGQRQDLSEQTQRILSDYSKLWGDLPFRNIAVTPTPGYFGQGFPGLIYLSDAAYLRPEDRPAFLRNPRQEAFFSQLLLPHEVAHQWWGNMVVADDYRSAWLMEAMANYAALQLIEKSSGAGALNNLLAFYRDDLKTPTEAAGPVDFGIRLLTGSGVRVWETIIYEKGTWVLHMLRERMGEERFLGFQRRILKDFSGKPLTNEDFRKTAAAFIPAGQPDKDLSLFFDTWVNGTGIPRLEIQRQGQTTELKVSEVPTDFILDVPLRCGSTIRWVRATQGENQLPDGNGSCKIEETAVLAK